MSDLSFPGCEGGYARRLDRLRGIWRSRVSPPVAGSNTVEGQKRRSRKCANRSRDFWRRCACSRRLAVRAAGLANRRSFSRQDHHRICRSVDDKCARRRRCGLTKQTGIKVVTSYDASSALMKQIEGGAHANFRLAAAAMPNH
jgi:hypothetical protein